MIKLPAPQQRYTLKREIKSEDREAIETNEGATTQIGIEEKLPKPAKKGIIHYDFFMVSQNGNLNFNNIRHRWLVACGFHCI